MELRFYKYQGAGNDFIIVDNRKGQFNGDDAKKIEFLCHRRFGIGADGLMTMEQSDTHDFEMKYYNSDGHEASMCGNGGRCIVAFAQKLGMIKDQARFMAADGEHLATIGQDGQVRLQMIDVLDIEEHVDGYFLNTGVPHLIHFVDDLHSVDVDIEGRQLRYDARFQPEGANVNFVKEEGHHLTVHTYERGVEAETLACGTGITAAVLSAGFKNKLENGNYSVTAKGGELSVSFDRSDKHFKNVWLKGPATLVFSGLTDYQP